jgi:hypothetical protein
LNTLLPPVYHCRVRYELDLSTGFDHLVFDTTPLPEGIEFSILYFTHVDIYWLTTWRQGAEEYWVGQTLWRNETPVAFGGGEITLYSPPGVVESKPTPDYVSVWQQVDQTIGLYGLSVVDAQFLQDPKNRVYLIPEQELFSFGAKA